jgi:hypothetical protein
LKAVLVLVALTASAETTLAQRAVTFAGGASNYDLQGSTGTDWVFSARAASPIGQYFIIEPSATFLRWQPAVGTKITYLIGELGVQAQAYVGRRLRPYIGSGLGVSTPTRNVPGGGQTFFALHAAAGVRLYVTRGWGIRGEFRARSIRPFSDRTYEVTLGIMQVQRGPN